MLRKMGIMKKFSVIGAILYAFIPGHYQRGEGHIYVGSCFAIPLIIVVAIHPSVYATCLYEMELPVPQNSTKSPLSIPI